MTALADNLPLEEWPLILLRAVRRRARKPPQSRQTTSRQTAAPSAKAGKAGRQTPRPARPANPLFSANNYIAEAPAMRRPGQTSPLGGRNRKGAGAPQGNANARGSRWRRQHAKIKKRLVAARLRLLVWKAAVDHWEQTQQRPSAHHHFRQNNFVAEGLSHAPPRPNRAQSHNPRMVFSTAQPGPQPGRDRKTIPAGQGGGRDR